MSALANTLPANQETHYLSESKHLHANALSDISVTTRIDYNLRFTKQAVLVVSDNAEQYSTLASQYLGSLSDNVIENNSAQTNVAFVSASTKLNDIQIRCRLVEQLFVNTLFDPEQSLSISVLKFSKMHGEAITIIVDHGHALSLQLKYELCQLVSQAKKHKLSVNVVIFGLTESAQQLSINKSLFKSKIAVIDAETGQILSLDNPKIQYKKTKIALSIWHKGTIFLLVLLLAIIVTWAYQNVIGVNTVILSTNQETVKTKQTLLENIKPINSVKDQKVRQLQKKEKIAALGNNAMAEVKVEASSEEISAAILALPALEPTEDTAEVIDSLTISPSIDELTSATEANQSVFESIKAEKDDNLIKAIDSTSQKIDNHYYLNQIVIYEEGYVIQIAGFTDKALWQQFVDTFSQEELFSYQRLLKEQRFFVVTSKVYPSKAAAKEALALLPESYSQRKPWLKDISSVINEINTIKTP